MAQKSRWSVTGVLPECREAAKVAARRAGLTMGEWLNRAIMDAAKQSIQGSPDSPVSNQLPALPVSELTQAIATLGELIEKQRENADTSGVDRADVEETVAPVAESVRQLEKNVDAKFDALELGDIAGPQQAKMQERVRDAEAKAERANLSLAPLERKVLRLSQQLEQRSDEQYYPEKTPAQPAGPDFRRSGEFIRFEAPKFSAGHTYITNG